MFASMKIFLFVVQISQSCWSIFLNQGFAAKGETKEGLMFMRKAQKLDPDTKVRVHRSKYYFT